MRSGNLLENLPTDLSEELLDELVAGPTTRIERIVSTGQSSPEGFWYEQEQDEWVVVLKGRAGLQLEGDDAILELKAGDWILIPARHRHRVVWTADDEPTLWLAVHFDGRSMRGQAPL